MRCLIGGRRAELGGDFDGGYYFEPTVLKGDNKMRVFQEEISDRCSPSPRSRTRRRPSRSPTTPPTASVLASGPATATWPTAWAGRSRRVGCGRTATTSTRSGRLRWLKISDVGREPPDDARALLTDQEPAGQLRHEAPRVLLTGLALEPTNAPRVRLCSTANKREVLR